MGTSYLLTPKIQSVMEKWQRQAETNLQKWGPRSLETMAVVLGEEYGELCRAILERNYATGTREAIVAELQDTAAVCIQMANALSKEAE